MARMSRDSFAKATGVFGRTAEELEKEAHADKIPEKNCGICKHYLENTYASDGRGTCSMLKDGSDITSDPPVFVLEGKTGTC